MSADSIGLDPDWVAANVVVDGRTPNGAAFAGFIGTGQMSRNARYSLDWGGAPGPATVVVKIPSADAGTRSVAFEHGIYQRECEFYRSVRPLTEVAAPALVAAHVADDDFCLVLEDLAGSVQGDQFTEATDEQLVLATAVPPMAVISSTTCWAGPASPPLPSWAPPRSLTTTFAPSSAISRA